MSLEDDLMSALLIAYRKAGEETGYWGRRFLQAIRRKGALPTVKAMLTPRTRGQRQGLGALLDANRPDLTVEAIVLRPEFASLFTRAEKDEARTRLGDFGTEAASREKVRVRLYPDELEPGIAYPAGARKQVRVNAFERNPAARRACLAHHGYACKVCDMRFDQRYGALGTRLHLRAPHHASICLER